MLPQEWQPTKRMHRAFEMKVKIAMIVTMLSSGIMGVWAQDQVEAHLGADIVSDYIWRGQDFGDVSLQPELSVAWKGLSLSAWGSVGLSDKDDARELDLTLSYETGGLSFGIIDYWNDGDGKPYFYYKNDDTAHSFEGFVSYDFGPVGASWQTYFAGSDYQADGKRAYSSYFELSAPFRLARLSSSNSCITTAFSSSSVKNSLSLQLGLIWNCAKGLRGIFPL